MFITIVICCILFQTGFAIYLLCISRIEGVFEKNMLNLLLFLLAHICLKLIFLLWLHNAVEYGKISTALGLYYGPLLYSTAMWLIGKPLSRQQKLLHITPFAIISSAYFILILATLNGPVSEGLINGYSMAVQWLVVISLLLYSIYSHQTLVRDSQKDNIREIIEDPRGKLVNRISTVFFSGMTCGALLELGNYSRYGVPLFELRFLPYFFFAFIPAMILSYKIRNIIHSRSIPPYFPEKKFTVIHFPELVDEDPGFLIEEISKDEQSLPDETPPSAESVEDKRYKKSAVSLEMMNRYQEMLNHYMQRSKTYLNAELSLESLAEEVDIPKHHLTQLLNEKLHKNFYHFINEYRIEEAKLKLESIQLQEFSLLSLAFDCGFNSKSSFNNYFKKITGQTPSFYRNQCLNFSKQAQLAK
jgi:AraC-like DNA-binding protein